MKLEIKYIKKHRFYKSFYKLNYPIFISQLLLVVIGIINSIIFGQLGEKVLASIAIVDKLNGIYWPILSAVSTVISIFLIQNEGSNRQEIKKIFVFTNFLMIGISVLALIIVSLFGKTLLSYYSNDTAVLKDSILYLWAIGIANMFATISYSMITYFNGLGKIKETSSVGMLQTLINFILYYIFIIKLEDYSFGIKGIALAIIITKLIELIVYMKIYNSKFSLKDITISSKNLLDMKLLKDISKYMAPLVINNIFFMFATNIIFLSFSRMGTKETAAVGITDSLIGYFYLLLLGVITSTKIMIGRLLGKKKMNAAYIYSKKIISIMFYASFICAIVMNILAKIYLKFYKIDIYTMKLSLLLIFIASLIFVVKMINALVVDGFLRIGGDIKTAILNDMIGIFIFGVGVAVFFTTYIKLSIILLYLAVNCNEIVRFTLNYKRYLKKKWLKKTV